MIKLMIKELLSFLTSSWCENPTFLSPILSASCQPFIFKWQFFTASSKWHHLKQPKIKEKITTNMIIWRPHSHRQQSHDLLSEENFLLLAPGFAPALGSLRALAPWCIAFPTTRPIYTTKTDSAHSFSPNEPAPPQQAEPSSSSHHSPVRTS